jgi:hypothetical protein
MDRLELQKVIARLREDLTAAQKEGEGKDLRFLADEVGVELQVSVTDEGHADGGIKFWVLNASAGAKATDATTQKISLKLKVVDKAGNPVKVSDKDRR